MSSIVRLQTPYLAELDYTGVFRHVAIKNFLNRQHRHILFNSKYNTSSQDCCGFDVFHCTKSNLTSLSLVDSLNILKMPPLCVFKNFVTEWMCVLCVRCHLKYFNFPLSSFTSSEIGFHTYVTKHVIEIAVKYMNASFGIIVCFVPNDGS